MSLQSRQALLGVEPPDPVGSIDVARWAHRPGRKDFEFGDGLPATVVKAQQQAEDCSSQGLSGEGG